MNSFQKIKTKFVIDKNFDVEGFLSIKDRFNLVDDSLFVAPKNTSELLEKVENVYPRDAATMLQQVSAVESFWHSKEGDFSRLASLFFADVDFPNFEYQLYPTIWPLIARDPVKHRIAFPYNCPANESCYVIAHEFLHELFYEHIDRVFAKKIDLNSIEIWDLSEVVNVLIMESPDWQKIFPHPTHPYKQHQALYETLSILWKKNPTIDALVRTVMNIK